MSSSIQFPSIPIKVSAELLALSQNVQPIALFKHLASAPWAIWLDSGQSDHIDACFDILVWQPEVTLCTYGNKTTIHHIKNNIVEHSDDDPLSLLDTIQKQTLATIVPTEDNLPFLGGALGYFSYDLGRRFEKLPASAEQDIKLPEMAVGIYSQAIIFNHKTQQYFLVCPQGKHDAIKSDIEKLIKTKEDKQTTQKFALASPWQSNMSEVNYTEKFNNIQQYLASGDCYQINLAQRFKAQYQGDEFHAYCALRLKNKAPFSAFMRLEDACILSVSPERFLQCKQGKVQSKPIKGTMPRSSDENKDKQNAQILANSIKDRAENLMIVDLLRNDISKVCIPTSVVVPKLFEIESFPAVHHLVSTVEGKLAENKTASDLLRGAFPGGSITGAPKIRAMEIIEQLEPHRRSVYCGSIGYISNCGTMDTSITIRTLICEKSDSSQVELDSSTSPNNIYCWAGGGIVADSIVSSEYQETFDKVNCILPVLASLGK